MLTFLSRHRFLFSPDGDFGGGGGATATADTGSDDGGGGGAGFGVGEHEDTATSAPPTSEGHPADSRTTPPARDPGRGQAAEPSPGDHLRAAIARAKGENVPAPRAPDTADANSRRQGTLHGTPAPQAPGTPAAGQLRVLSLSESDWQNVDPAQRAAIEPIVMAKLAELEEKRYLPVARQVHADHQANVEYFQQVQEVMASEPYQLAQWLGANPQAYQAVMGFLRGEQPAAGSGQGQGQGQGGGLPQIDPNTLDPEARLIYQHAQAAQNEVQQLRQQFAEAFGQIDQRVGSIDEFRQGEIARQQSAAHSFAEGEASRMLAEAVGSAKKALGFDPTRYGDLMSEAYRTVQAFTAAGHWNPRDLSANLTRALKMCGAGEIAARIKAQANGGGEPPADRAAGGESSFESTLKNAITTAKREQYGQSP